MIDWLLFTIPITMVRIYDFNDFNQTTDILFNFNWISFMYLGGYITRSPYYVVIPRGGFWHVAIDLGGYEGRIGSSVEIISPEKIEVGLTFMGYPAKKYPNKKKPDQFTDYLFGGANGVPDGPGHGHAIIQNSSGNIMFLREPNTEYITIWDKSIYP